MPYNPTTWVDDKTPLSAANLNKMEQGIADATAAADEALNVAHASVKKAGDTMTGLLTIYGSGVWPYVSPKNADAPSSEYPNGLSTMTVWSNQTGWPSGTASVLTFVGARDSNQRIWQLAVSRVLGDIWFRTRNNDDTAWEPFYRVWTDKSVGSGANNRDVRQIKAVLFRTDTRSIALTYDGSNRLTKVHEMDGSAIVKSTTLNYDSNGRLSSVVETAGGASITSTFSYDANGNLASVTRA